MECFAEALGVFFYCYAGIGSTAPWVIGNILKQAGLSSILQIGFGYMGGILLAIVICAPTSGGHFNPCVTITNVVFRGFPPLKAVRYITAQILGGYVACALVYSQYKVLIDECEAGLVEAGTFDSVNFTPNGLAGIFALYLLPGQTFGRVVLNEFVTDVFLGLAIWAATDISNTLIPPSFGPVVVSLAYAVAVWGFSLSGLVTNTARDLGGRLLAVSVWGTQASGGKYAAIAALTNIPATLFAAFLYEMFLTDSDRVVPKAGQEFVYDHLNHRRHRHDNPLLKRAESERSPSRLEMQTPGDEKAAFEHSEIVH